MNDRRTSRYGGGGGGPQERYILNVMVRKPHWLPASYISLTNSCPIPRYPVVGPLPTAPTVWWDVDGLLRQMARHGVESQRLRAAGFRFRSEITVVLAAPPPRAAQRRPWSVLEMWAVPRFDPVRYSFESRLRRRSLYSFDPVCRRRSRHATQPRLQRRPPMNIGTRFQDSVHAAPQERSRS